MFGFIGGTGRVSGAVVMIIPSRNAGSLTPMTVRTWRYFVSPSLSPLIPLICKTA